MIVGKCLQDGIADRVPSEKSESYAALLWSKGGGRVQSIASVPSQVPIAEGNAPRRSLI
jgi:hypothetical protein